MISGYSMLMDVTLDFRFNTDIHIRDHNVSLSNSEAIAIATKCNKYFLEFHFLTNASF